MATLKDLQDLLNKTANEMPQATLKIVQIEGLKFIKKNFNDEGFNTGASVKKVEKKSNFR